MVSLRAPVLRVALCLILLAAQGSPAAAAVAEIRSQIGSPISGLQVMPISAPSLSGGARLTPTLSTTLSAGILALPAPAVRATALPAPAQAPAPVSSTLGSLTRVGSLIGSDQDRGGARSVQALQALFSGEAQPALADFLGDVSDYRPEGAVSSRLETDGRDHVRLVFERADGSRREVSGQFLTGSQGRPAFVLMGPAEVSASGEVRQEHPGFWREYSGAGQRLEWSSQEGVDKRGWGPWARAHEIQKVALTEQSLKDGRWQAGASQEIKTVTVKEGRSWLGRAGDWFLKARVLGPVMKFCDDTAVTVLTGLLLGVNSLVSAFSDTPGRNIEAGGNVAKSPVVRHFTKEKDQWHLDRLSDEAREKLWDKVRQVRRAAVANQLFPVSSEAAERFVAAPIPASEAVAVLREQFGVGTYGRRLIQAGSERQGWKRVGFNAAGVTLGALEGAAESVCNPILWAMLGFGSVANAIHAAAGAATKVVPAAWRGAAVWFKLLKGHPGAAAMLAGSHFLASLKHAALSPRATGMLTALYALRTAEATATVLWWVPWLFSATDHIGRMVQLTAQADFDRDYFQQMSKLGTDALYYFVIP